MYVCYDLNDACFFFLGMVFVYLLTVVTVIDFLEANLNSVGLSCEI